MRKVSRKREPSLKFLSKQSLDIPNLPSECSSSSGNVSSLSKKHTTQTPRKQKHIKKDSHAHDKESIKILNVLKSYMSNPLNNPKLQGSNIAQQTQNNNPWNQIKTEVMTHKQYQTSSIDCLATPSYKFDICQPGQIMLERIDPDVKQKSFCLFIDHEIKKMNEQICKIESIYEKNMGINQIMNPLNSLILMMNFVVGKISYKGQQILLECDQIDAVNSQLKTELIIIKNENETLLKSVSNVSQTELQLRQQTGRLRAVMESYQLQNHQLRNEIHILNDVIQEMNIQVQKSEKKFSNLSKQFNSLKQQYQIISSQNVQLQGQIQEFEGTLNGMKLLQQQLHIMQLQKQKWRFRCHEEMNEKQKVCC